MADTNKSSGTKQTTRRTSTSKSSSSSSKNSSTKLFERISDDLSNGRLNTDEAIRRTLKALSGGSEKDVYASEHQ